MQLGINFFSLVNPRAVERNCAQSTMPVALIVIRPRPSHAMLEGAFYGSRRMIIALILILIGVVFGLRAKVFILIPVAVVISAAVFPYWIATGGVEWIKVAIWFGYLAALNTGYIVGRIIVLR